MVIRIKKKLYFKPRLCPDCGKPCLFCKCHLSQRCKRCHKKHDNWRHHKKNHIKRRAIQKLKYNPKYKRMRKRLIKAHPYCSLCGSEIRLTVHHVGGGLNIIQSYVMIAIRHMNVGISKERQKYALDY